MVAQSAEFKKAIEDSRSMSQKPTNDELLEVCDHSLDTGMRVHLSTWDSLGSSLALGSLRSLGLLRSHPLTRRLCQI
jgi:hypothetical protein